MGVVGCGMFVRGASAARFNVFLVKFFDYQVGFARSVVFVNLIRVRLINLKLRLLEIVKHLRVVLMNLSGNSLLFTFLFLGKSGLGLR